MPVRAVDRRGPGASDAAAERARLQAARRRFVLANHPDRGGDPVAFAQGLRAFDDARPSQTITFYRRRGVLRRSLAALARVLARTGGRS
ncbi:hypothetical protein CcI49_23950 [Frankia sp. CcI49]|uniref:hypothetical protein n=1 Tax=Frankia sp. CcI49 TaxID=1745382 RepID=UPI0009777820|nr:hypothetical protein [Frankia sp. CcI49]ONH57988.1 hypothetical protein CcI49_23950 [Frankia sp. CcI49]